MDEIMPILAKKFRELVRVAYFMWRKGISKGKILSHLNFMMVRSKIAGKLEAIHNLIFHHHSSSSFGSRCHHLVPAKLNGHVRFSFRSKRKYFKATIPPAPLLIDSDLVEQALDKIDMDASDSPVLPGFGRSPPVRQLKITDSPYPIRDFEEDNHVDEAADEFIKNFYKDLKRQNALAYIG